MVKIDHVLKLYAETIQSPYLHYGMWDDPLSVDPEELSLTDIRNAQELYITNLSNYIPDGVRTILDVGCGLGGNAAYLHQHGFQVEALSPDLFQQEIFHQKFDTSIQFHLSKFETFEIEKRYDLILMSESASYIKMRPGIERAWELLTDGGYWLVSDYFIVHSDGSRSPHLKSAHHLARYMSAASDVGFDLLEDMDVTENVMPTLDAAHYLYCRYAVPITQYATASLQKHAPKLTKLLKWVYRRKIEKKMGQVDYLKSEEFRKYKKYMILLFQKGRR